MKNLQTENCNKNANKKACDIMHVVLAVGGVNVVSKFCSKAENAAKKEKTLNFVVYVING